MASGSGCRWHVVYSQPPSKRKADGFLALRFMPGNVVRKILLLDPSSSVLDERFLRKHEELPSPGATLTLDKGFEVSVDAPVDAPVEAPSFSTLIPRPRSAPSTSSLAPPSTLCSSHVDPAPIATVGTRWDVLYTMHPKKKSKKTHEGVLRLAQKTEHQQKVVLCDNEGTPIDQRFLRGGEEITNGMTLEFEHVHVEVLETKEDPSSLAEVRIIQGMPGNQKKLQWRRPDSSLQGMAANDSGEREALQVCQDRIGRIQNPSKASIQPKRRDSRQILNKLKRPIDLSGTTNSCSREQLEREGISMIQQKNELSDHRRSIVENLDVQTGTFMEQNEIEAEKFERKTSPYTKRGPSKCFEKMSIRPFRSPQTTGALVATQSLSSKRLSLDFQVDVPAVIRRRVMIPDEFISLDSYQRIMTSAITEELNIILYDLAKRFGDAKSELSRIPGSSPSCEHGATQLKRQPKDGGRLFFVCKSNHCRFFSWADESGERSGVTSSGEELEHRYYCYNLEFYSDCELFLRSKKTWYKSIGEDTVHKNPSVSEKTSVLLKLCHLKRFAKHSKDEIWVISSNPNFRKIRSDDFLAVAVSKWYGLSTEGTIELELFGQKPQQLKGLFALHDRGVTTELLMLEVIRSLHPSRVPLLPLLLCSKQPERLNIHQATVGKDSTSSEEDLEGIVAEHLHTTISNFKLNEDQTKVLLFVSKWFLASGREGARVNLQNPELCLVHGTFGSGKSFLLVVLVIFITKLLKVIKDTTSRILISAATNIAVDRILVGLLERGFKDFMRVGSFDKISKSILPYSVSTIAHSDEDKERIQELQQLMKRANPARRRALEEELQNIKEGKRREKLEARRVVGVTCHSCNKPVLEGQNFTICFLDECSQMPEPLSLLPLTGCAKLIAVGDPAQLPPTLSHVGAEVDDEQSNCTENNSFDEINTQTHDGEPSKTSSDLRRALFVRLAKVYKPILLRTQYRCHPRLAAVPNSLFYEEKLINGCMEVDRPPLVQGLPPLLFCDTGREGVEKKDGLGFQNEYEADLASQIIMYLISQGIPGLQIGVIVFYKSQAVLVEHKLGRKLPRDPATLSNSSKTSLENDVLVDVQVSTVDAFQGMEKNIILLSCCRTNGLGFVAISNRLNVALTRARHHLIIIGKAENLHSNVYWKKLLSSVRSSPGAYKPAQEFSANLSARQRRGSSTNSHLEAVSLDTKNCNREQECGIDVKPSIRLSRSSQPVSARLGDDPLCSEEASNFLDNMHFRVEDFWAGYKLYCFGHYSQCDLSKDQFLESKMGRFCLALHKERVALWGAKFDETVREVWMMMEEYIRIRYDKDCTNLRALMEEFEDEKELSTSEKGLLLLQIIKHVLTEFHIQDDERGTERLYKHERSVHIQSTDIFDQFRRRLNSVDSNLGNLLKSKSDLGASSSFESGCVGNTGDVAVDSRNKPKKLDESAKPSFDLGF